jgi:hypothetical protein
VPRCAQATGKQHTSPAPVACQHSSQLTTWTAQVERVFGAFASREPQPASARTRAGPDGRANSTTLRSGARPTGKMVAEWPAPAHDHGRSARNLAHTKPRARRAAAANHTHSDTAEGPRALLKVSNPEWRRTVASVAERQDSSKSSARSAMRAVLFSDVDCEYPPTHPPRGTRAIVCKETATLRKEHAIRIFLPSTNSTTSRPTVCDCGREAPAGRARTRGWRRRTLCAAFR